MGQDISLGMSVGIYTVSPDSDWPELQLNPGCSSDSLEPLPLRETDTIPTKAWFKQDT